MAAFAAAVNLGFRYVETDVHATRDGVPVAFHDATLDRVAGVAEPIGNLQWNDLRHMKIGEAETIPALDELLGTWPDLRVNIDVKAASAIEPTVRVLERTQAHDRVLIASFSDTRRRQIVCRLSRPVSTSAGAGVARAFWAASTAGASAWASRTLRDVDCLQLPVGFRGLPVITRKLLDAAHAAGRQVHAWTINDPVAMARLLDLGVDGLITDRADLLRELLIARGQWTVT